MAATIRLSQQHSCSLPDASRAPDRKHSTPRHGRLLHPSSWAERDDRGHAAEKFAISTCLPRMPESGSLIAAGRKYPLSSTFAKAHAVRTCRRRLSGFATGTPPDARRFSAVDELALSASLRD